MEQANQIKAAQMEFIRKERRLKFAEKTAAWTEKLRLEQEADASRAEALKEAEKSKLIHAQTKLEQEKVRVA